MEKIRVVVNGALGNMGREVIQAVMAERDLLLVGAVDTRGQQEDTGIITGTEKSGIAVSADLSGLLERTATDVVIDFTTPIAVMANIQTILHHKVRPVVGTTGITEVDLQQVETWVENAGVGCFIAPNFALGAVLMMVLAARAAPFMDAVEIVELHHDQKIDSPSGTSLKAAEMIANNLALPKKLAPEKRLEKVPGTRGGNHEGINIHSVRMPGLMAHHRIILGGVGQTLTISHDSLSRKSFIPGILMAVRRIIKENKLIYGLENILSI
jgi:4-hydroxy-tetrahydrodipicolinate reductase